jgi:hypothetical protein
LAEFNPAAADDEKWGGGGSNCQTQGFQNAIFDARAPAPGFFIFLFFS